MRLNKPIAVEDSLVSRINFVSLSLSLSLSLQRGGPRPPSRVSSILPGLGWLNVQFLHPSFAASSSLHLPSATWVSLWGEIEHSRSLSKIHSFSNVFYSVSCLVVVHPSVRFSLYYFPQQENFYKVGESVQRSTPNLEDQGTSLSLTPTLRPVRQGWPYQKLRYRRHSSPG